MIDDYSRDADLVYLRSELRETQRQLEVLRRQNRQLRREALAAQEEAQRSWKQLQVIRRSIRWQSTIPLTWRKQRA